MVKKKRWSSWVEIHERRDYGEAVATTIDEEVSSFIDHAFKSADKIIRQYKEKLEIIVTTLLEKETIEREEFERLMANA